MSAATLVVVKDGTSGGGPSPRGVERPWAPRELPGGFAPSRPRRGALFGASIDGANRSDQLATSAPTRGTLGPQACITRAHHPR